MKIQSKRIMSIMLVLMLTLTGLVAIAPASSAKPMGNVSKEKLQIESIEWDKDAQEFIVEMSLKFGIAMAGERAGFTVSTKLEIKVGKEIFLIESDDDAIQRQKGAVKGRKGFIKIEDQHLPWNRNGGDVEGEGIVTVSIGIRNPSGRLIGRGPVVHTVGGITFEPAPRPIYVVNGYDNTVSVIDSSKVDDGISGNEVIEVINLVFDGYSNLIDVDNSRGRVYVASAQVNAGDHDRVSVIDETTIDDGISGNEVIDALTWEIPFHGQYPPGGATFWGINVCEYHQNIWVSLPNLQGMLAFDGMSGNVIHQAVLHPGSNDPLPLTVDIDEFRNLVYIASHGMDQVDVIDENKIDDGITDNEVIDSIGTGDFPYGISFDSVRNRIYVTNQKDNTVSVIDGSKVADGIPENELLDTIAVGSMPSLVGLDRSRNRIYIANQGDGTVSVIDGSKVDDNIFGNEVIDTIEVGSGPLGVAVDRRDNKIYVTNHDANTVAVIDGLRVDDGIIGNEVINTITVGNGPTGIAVSNFALT